MMKVQGAGKHPFLLVISKLQKGSFGWNFLFFFHRQFFTNFAVSKPILQSYDIQTDNTGTERVGRAHGTGIRQRR